MGTHAYSVHEVCDSFAFLVINFQEIVFIMNRVHIPRLLGDSDALYSGFNLKLLD